MRLLRIVGSVLLLGMMMQTVRAESAAKVQVKVLQSNALQQLYDGKQAKTSLIEVTWGPGAGSPPHRHPGPVVGHVLEGTLEFQIGDQPLRTLKAGDSFFEPAMILHRVARNPAKDRRTRVMVVMIHPADAQQLTILEPTAQAGKVE